MQNFGQGIQKTSILNELSGANAELGEAFALIMNDMVVQSGITNPDSEPFEIVPNSWRNLAAKPDKTQEDIQNLDKAYRAEVQSLAESYLLFIAKETRNLTGKLEYQQYEAYMLKYRFGRYDVMNKPEYLAKVKQQIRNAFNKIAGHGEDNNDGLITKSDMWVYIYALSMKAKHNNGVFAGFEIDGIITPEEYAVAENNLFQNDNNNLFSLKLRTAYKILNNKL